MSGTQKQGQNYFGNSNFGVNTTALKNGGVKTSSVGKTTPPKNHTVQFINHPANKKLHGKPMAK